MAKQINFEQNHNKGFNVMKKIKEILILIIGILIFLVSYVLDQPINSFFKGFRFAPLDFIFSIITNFGVVVFVMLIIPLILLFNKNKKKGFVLLMAFIISIVSSFIIKLIVLRHRPTELINFPFINVADYSFPSMHASAVFSLLPLLNNYLPRQKYFWISFTLLVAFTRIYFRFHFLSDVVFGALFGYFIGYSILVIFEKKKYGNKQI